MSRLHVKSDYILQCSCSSAFFHPLFSYCCSPEVLAFSQPVRREQQLPSCLRRCTLICRDSNEPLLAGQCPVMLKNAEHLRDLTMFWFVSPFLARFHKHFRIDGWILVMQLDLLSCALQASQTISQVHMIFLLFCGVCERRVDGFGATLAASSSLESSLQAPTLKSERKANEVGYFPLWYQVFKVLH